jgi:hypothetical protein
MLAPTARGMVVTDGYDSVDPRSLLGTKPAGMLNSHQAVMQGSLSSATNSVLERDSGKPWSPDNPLFWFGGLLLVTFGLIGAATTVRVGPFKASLGAGKS